MKIVIAQTIKATAFDRGDFELADTAAHKKTDEHDEEKKFHTLLSNIRIKIAEETHKLAHQREHLAKAAVAKATAFINGLKKRYNELYKKQYGVVYYTAVANNSRCKRVISKHIHQLREENE